LLLIGMFDSPFVRRVAVSLKRLGLPFEHANWSVGKDFDRIRKYNPLGRVPTLVLDDGEALIESSAILDYVDVRVGPAKALLPPSGRERRDALRLIAMAVGAGEKGREQIYEKVFRPVEKRHEPWLERCRSQMNAALTEIERACVQRGVGEWLLPGRLTQADITVTCVFTFLSEAQALSTDSARYPSLSALVARCEALPEFVATRTAYSAPSTTE
jgi:glutathione S-transferase